MCSHLCYHHRHLHRRIYHHPPSIKIIIIIVVISVVVIVSLPEKVSWIAVFILGLVAIESLLDASQAVESVVGVTQAVAALAGTRARRVPVHVTLLFLPVESP